MGRVKREIKRIDSNKSRQVTYTKRKNGLVKKAYELSVLCDVDIGLIMFSPDNQLTHFSGKTRIEDVFDRYLKLSDEERGSHCSRPENTENLINVLNQIRTENEVALQAKKAKEPETEELSQEQRRLQQQLETAEEQLRYCEPDLSNMTSLEEIESHEKQVERILSCVTKKKECLLNNQASTSYSASSIQEMQQQMTSAFENYACGMPDNDHNHTQINHASLSFVPSREFTPSMSNSVLHATSSNFIPNIIEEVHIAHPDNENLVPCHHDYVPSDPNAFDMPPPLLLPPIQNWIEEQLEMPCDSAILHTTTSLFDQQTPSTQLNADTNMLKAHSEFLLEQLMGDEVE